MEVVWRKGSATVAEVAEALNDESAYTTVLTFMRILRAKGYLSSMTGRERRRIGGSSSSLALP